MSARINLGAVNLKNDVFQDEGPQEHGEILSRGGHRRKHSHPGNTEARRRSDLWFPLRGIRELAA
jgi:hypothetical protein